MTNNRLLAAIFAVSAMLACAAPALAVDGTIEINQAKVIAAGGFPYNINASGSYRLTGNLTVSSTTSDAVDVNVGNVTIDLNGFSIIGPGNSTSGGNGIFGGNGALTVENGSVTGFSIGIETSTNGIVRNVQANANKIGIDGDNATLISGNTASSNTSFGIVCSGNGCLITGNTLFGNGTALSASSSLTGYSGNLLTANTTNFQGGTSLGAKNTNLCDGTAC